MSRLMLGAFCGLIYGVLSAVSMLPLEFPDKLPGRVYSIRKSRRALRLARRYDEAIQQQRKAIELEPDYWVGRSWLGHAYSQKGLWLEAIASFEKARSIEDIISEPLTGLGYVYAVSGKKDEALKVLDELNDRAKHPYVSSYLVATVYAGLGDKDRAFESLEKAFEARSWYLTHLKLDPELDRVRSDSRLRRSAATRRSASIRL